MNKKFIATLLSMSVLLTGCDSEPVNVNVSNDSNLAGNVFGESALIEIGDSLYYDSTTRIVYWWNGADMTSKVATTPSPYYAPNGLPYRYNSETKSFGEIKGDS